MGSQINATTGRPLITGYHKHPSACKWNLNCKVCIDNYLDGGKQTGGADATIRVSEDAALATIKRHVESINRDYTALCNAIASKGDKLLSRWKRNPAKRETYIRQAFSKMPEKRWAHLYAYFSSGQGAPTPDYRKSFRRTFLLPYITQQAFLQDPTRLVKLLFLRTQHPPQKWAWIDHQLTRFGRRSGMLASRFSDTIFSTSTLLSEYGKPATYDEQAFHLWQQVGFPVAEILFEAQHALYKLLRKTVDLMLEGSEDSATADRTWKEQGAKGFEDLLPKDHNGTVLRVPAQPFDPPPAFSLRKMRALVTERQTAVEEELWLLQTDVISAMHTVTTVEKGAHFRSLSNETRWPAIAFQLTQPLLKRARFWSPYDTYLGMIEVARNHPETPQAMQQGIGQQLSLPPNVDSSLAIAHYVFASNLETHFSDMLVSTTKTDPYFDGTLAAEAKSSKQINCSRFQALSDRISGQIKNMFGFHHFTDDPILWAVIELSTLELTDDTVREGVFPVLEDLLLAPEGCQVDVSRLEQTAILGHLADFAAGLSVQSILEAHAPKFQPVTMAEAHAFMNTKSGRFLLNAVKDKRKHDGTKSALYQNRFIKGWYKCEEMYKRLAKAGSLLKAFYDLKLPVEPKRTRTWMQHALKAKAALDEFWAEIREIEIQNLFENMKKRSDMSSLTRAMVETWKDISILDCYKETDFVEATQADIDEEEARQARSANKRKVDEDIERQRLEDERLSTTQGSPPKRPKLKNDDQKKPLKRKDQPTSDTPPVPPIDQPPAAAPPSPDKISASATSLELFARLWPHQSRTVEGGVVRYGDVLAAMADIGYPGVAVGGSGWSFSGDEGTLVLHAPHGKKETPVARWQLLFFGRRLRRHYGWEWKRFVERGV